MRALTAVVLYCYILTPQTPKSAPSSRVKSIFLTLLLQCTSIDWCALFMRAKKKNYFIKFLSPLPLKKIYSLSFFFFLSLSGFSSFFLFPSHFFFLSLIYSLLRWSILDLHHCRSSSSSPTLPSYATDPSWVLHLTAHPTSTSLVLHLTTDPISIADLSFIVNPSSTDTAFIELKSVVDFVVGFRGCGWILWVSLGFVTAVWLGFMVAGFRGSVVVWLCWWWFVL